MNTWAEPDLRQEKNRLVAMLTLSLCIAGLMLFMMIRPQVRQLGLLQEALQQVDQKALQQIPLHGSKQDALQQARKMNRQLQHDLDILRNRFNRFGNRSAFLENVDEQAGGRIDFKVALLEAREHLQTRADADQSLPEDLGMADTIDTDEKAGSRLRQLAAIVRLVEQIQDLNITQIDHIQPMVPLSYPLSAGDPRIKREFPVHVRFTCSHPVFIQFLDALRMPENFFTLRRIQCEKLNGDASDLVRVTAACGAGLIEERPLLSEESSERIGADEEPEPVPETLIESDPGNPGGAAR